MGCGSSAQSRYEDNGDDELGNVSTTVNIPQARVTERRNPQRASTERPAECDPAAGQPATPISQADQNISRTASVFVKVEEQDLPPLWPPRGSICDINRSAEYALDRRLDEVDATA